MQQGKAKACRLARGLETSSSALVLMCWVNSTMTRGLSTGDGCSPRLFAPLLSGVAPLSQLETAAALRQAADWVWLLRPSAVVGLLLEPESRCPAVIGAAKC